MVVRNAYFVTGARAHTGPVWSSADSLARSLFTRSAHRQAGQGGLGDAVCMCWIERCPWWEETSPASTDGCSSSTSISARSRLYPRRFPGRSAERFVGGSVVGEHS